MNNFDTDKLIIVCYPPNTGGKFLINCLGLSSNAFFQDSNLVKLQLANKFTPEDKINHLCQRLDKVTTHWTDLDFSWLSLFNISINQVQKYVPLLPSIEIFADDLLLNETYDILQKQDCYFFFETHNDLGVMSNLIQKWPMAKVILFNNHYENFLTVRNEQNRLHEWQHIDINGAILWNADDYLNEIVFLEKIEMVYKELKLMDFNIDYIRTYYRAWIDKLNQISSNFNK